MQSDETYEDGEKHRDVNPDSEPAYDLGQVFIGADAVQWQVVRRWLDIDEDDPDRQYVYELQNSRLWELRLNERNLTPFSEESR